ncbi:uncharacterized protein BP5553_06892 [Venustampulla echinocandica]|uniref:ferric-chelate reductase (NADPH) n=1 Tax=Venustampulla echinocandica TaxID=2656787 RepID=A0A370TL71_9HELO|nr:uncharacterized protein BP5553_06892 [Venustampulla echinocandica]RDL36280.1 hypothetical protein BP5553_06892 [Venustampulla echinocandica]
MSVINLIPLLCGSRLSLVTRLLGISLRTSIGSHQWFGRTAIAQMLVHTIAVLRERNAFAWTTNNFTGVAGSTFGFIFLLSIRLVRRALYEWFLNSHLLLSAVVCIAIWRHVSLKKPTALFLRVGIYLWTIVTVAHWVLFAFRNFVFGRPFATAEAKRPWNVGLDVEDLELSVLQVDITVPRPWQVKAGQFVFLSIPKLGIFTGLRGHPFMITWWKRDRKGLTISLLVRSRAGFTAELDRHSDKSLRAFIDGPYGIRHNFGEYGAVVMFATGIGIAGHIPYIKDLIRGYNSCEVKTRSIRLVWDIREQRHELWVGCWMDELLKMDTGYVQKPVPDYERSLQR